MIATAGIVRWRAALWTAFRTALIIAMLATAPAISHEVRPALLQLTGHGPGRYDVLWKQPMVGDLAVHLVPHLSGGAIDRPPDAQYAEPGFRIETWQVQGTPLDGQTVSVEGLSASVTDVLLRVSGPRARDLNTVLRPAAPRYVLDLSGPKGIAVSGYLRMGVEHILTGFDHLMFVFGLFLLVGTSWRLVKAITAFTCAHTITLGLAALDYIRFPSALIEALVALSIVFVACELLADPKGSERLAHRHPWAIAFAFGLLHGLAFASALADVGLPQGAAPQALLLFNLGVEIGQLSFIGAVIALAGLLRNMPGWRALQGRAWSRIAPAYLIGGFSAYWLIERIVAALEPTA